ncbi:MAG: hypothetical protein V4558_04070 [Gemmatimonadota bacterium]
MWGEILASDEVEYCASLLSRLGDVPWCKPLVQRVEALWPPKYTDKSFLFELRFAAEIHDAGLEAEYEFAAGVGDSTVDFRMVHEGTEWLIELVSVMTSDAVREATVEDGLKFSVSLGSGAQDPRQSLAGEMILVQQKIGGKVHANGGPTKFPPPRMGTRQLVYADVRGYGITGGDVWDYRQIAYGPEGLIGSGVPFGAQWKSPTGEGGGVRGLFQQENTSQRSAQLVRERLHFIGFSANDVYAPGALRADTLLLANPGLLLGEGEVRAAYEAYPLRRGWGERL